MDHNLDIFKSSLGLLGKHPLAQRHTFLELKVQSKNLESLEGIQSYPLLVYVNASNNNIQDLEPLAALQCLTQLDLSANKLSSCLQYFPPLCNQIKSWPSGQDAIGSMLTLANLSYNNIEVIDDLCHHPFLECLILRGNKIRVLKGLDSLRHLKVLDLSENCITAIEGLENLPIEEINLSNNSIKSLGGLSQLSNLTYLDVSNNQISSLGSLVSNSNVCNLNVGFNSILQVRQVEFLGELQWLKKLTLAGNPCSIKHFYRHRVIYRLPALIQLDAVCISGEEQIRAMNLYGNAGGDLKQRADVFNKYFPGEEFLNYAEKFEDDELEMSASDLYDGVKTSDE